MKTFNCTCGNTLFFHSSHCIQCGKTTGMCPTCSNVVPVKKQEDKAGACGNPDCGAALHACENRSQHEICNRFIDLEVSEAKEKGEGLCSYCDLNNVIPDLSVDGNIGKWKKLEAAKHRTLYAIEQLGFPICKKDDACEPKLTFEFKADDEEPVSTGHANGCITINIREADSVEREKTRVEFGEPHRTLIGHFRHELGHYYWELLVKPRRLDAFRKLFGDETNPDYATAQQHYYESGPKTAWQADFVSGYATMHPWEDFAETFGAYLDLQAVLSTAEHFQLLDKKERDFDSLLQNFQQIGIVANELNRDMGLLDLVPEVYTQPVAEKLRFIHELRRI